MHDIIAVVVVETRKSFLTTFKTAIKVISNGWMFEVFVLYYHDERRFSLFFSVRVKMNVEHSVFKWCH